MYPPEVAPVRPGEELAWEDIGRYLQGRIDGIGGLTSVLQFPHGTANLTYLLRFEHRELVLRRPPMGRVAVGAHDMKREFRVLSRLWRYFDRAPRSFLLCDDHFLMDADFVIIEYRRGQVVRGLIPPSLASHTEVGHRIGLAVIDALADLHLLDPITTGLEDLGRPEGFLQRQLTSWQSRWLAVADDVDMPLVEEIAAELSKTMPTTEATRVLHNDFKIDNCQFDPNDPDRVATIFDWDMATLGDPLVDLGTLLNYWPDPADGNDRAIFPDGLDKIGLPTRLELRERYSERTGFSDAALDWYEAFASWKTAIVLQQLYARYVRGETTDERQAKMGARVASQARRSARILNNYN